MTTRTSEPDYYQVLGVEPSAGAAAIKKAYRALMMRLHPDKNPDPAANERAKLVNRAYEVVGNPQSRATYDEGRGVRYSGSGQRRHRSDTAAQAAREAERRMREEEEARWRAQPEPVLARADVAFVPGHWYAHPKKGTYQVVEVSGGRVRIRYRDGAIAKFIPDKLWSAWQEYLRPPPDRSAPRDTTRTTVERLANATSNAQHAAEARARRDAERWARRRAEERRAREREIQRRWEAEERRRREAEEAARAAAARAQAEAEERARREAEEHARREAERRERVERLRLEQEQREQDRLERRRHEHAAARNHSARVSAPSEAATTRDVVEAARRHACEGRPHKAAQVLAQAGWVMLVDKRPERGPLFVVPHEERRTAVDVLFHDLKRSGIPLVYARGGGGVTEGQAVWLMR